MSERVVGYILLISGIFIALGCVFNIYLTFTRKVAPISLFNLPGISFDITQSLPQDLKNVLNRSANTKTEIFPASELNLSLNLFAHVMLMGFILNFGFKLAGLGIQLLRPINIDLKTKTSS